MSNAKDLCANCGNGLGGAPYCAQCGQRVVEDRDFSLIHLTQDWIEATFSLDSRGLTTLRRLLFQPGRLSADYIAGRRGDTFGPFQIFLVITLAFFLLPDSVDIFKAPARFVFGEMQDLVGAKMAALDMTREELIIAYDARVSGLSKLALIVLILPLCLTNYLMAIRSMPQLGKHLIIAIHGLAFIMIFLMLALGLVVAIAWSTGFHVPKGLNFFFVLTGIALYLALQHRRIFDRTFWLAGLNGVVLMSIFVVSTILYRKGISWLSLWSL